MPRFQKGVSGNPKGMKPGQFSLVAKIKQRLQTLDPNTNQLYADLLVDSYVLDAISKSDMKRDAIDRIDGKPAQTTKIQGDAENPLKSETIIRIVDATKE